MQIRLAIAADASAIEPFDEFGGQRQHEIAAQTCFVAEHDSEVIGYASYAPAGLLGQPLLTYLCVRPAFRRQGVASRLVQQVQSVARGRRLLSSTEDWCTGTQHIFERLGWRRIGQLADVNKDGSTELFYAIDIDSCRT
jgi:GNAT superfamily N-acetyltransferase